MFRPSPICGVPGGAKQTVCVCVRETLPVHVLIYTLLLDWIWMHTFKISKNDCECRDPNSL